MCFVPTQDFFHKSMHVIKKKEIFDHKVFKLQRFSNFFLPILEGSLIQKTT